jgi:hypothetical protein
MMEAVRTSETSVYLNETTRRYIPEDSKLHTRRRENLKSHTNFLPRSLKLGHATLRIVVAGYMIWIFCVIIDMAGSRVIYYIPKDNPVFLMDTSFPWTGVVSTSTDSRQEWEGG